MTWLPDATEVTTAATRATPPPAPAVILVQRTIMLHVRTSSGVQSNTLTATRPVAVYGWEINL